MEEDAIIQHAHDRNKDKVSEHVQQFVNEGGKFVGGGGNTRLKALSTTGNAINVNVAKETRPKNYAVNYIIKY